jgi:hypothetical protein
MANGRLLLRPVAVCSEKRVLNFIMDALQPLFRVRGASAEICDLSQSVDHFNSARAERHGRNALQYLAVYELEERNRS